MKQKPVAWMLNGKLHDCDPSDWAKDQYPDQYVIPLYREEKHLSDSELLLELFSRHEAGIAPTTRKFYGGTWVSYVIGIGKNNSIAIEVTKEDIEALHRENKE